MRKRIRVDGDGDRFRKAKINLTHLAGKKKWIPFLSYLHELKYIDDIRGNSGFIQEALIPSPRALYCRQVKFKGLAFVIVFYKKTLPEELHNAIKERCLVYA